MSDEPLYCIKCGDEIDERHRCGFVFETDALPPREARYCECCGVVPCIGGECHFYARGGNSRGCVQ